MSKKFDVYAQVRATRQLAGDVASEVRDKMYAVTPVDGDGVLNAYATEALEWGKIEDELNRLEMKLERMKLSS